MVGIFNIPKERANRRRVGGKMRSTTIREFGGGWNVIDAPAALSLKFATVLKNFYRKADGTQALRYGTRYVADVSGEVNGDIVDINYFNGAIICPTEDGEIASVDAVGAVTAIWNSTLAAALPGAPSGWSPDLDSFDFTEIKGSLVICNGVDKPLEIQDSLAARYLQDLATGSNVNTPIGKYCTTVADYLCIAGVAAEPNVVYIGSKGTIGTFVGDTAPNDSVALNVGAYAPEEGDTIRGISSFRNYLFVHFLTATLKIVLGEYDEDGNHVPRIDDTLQKFGIVGHRVSIPVVNDLLFGDVSGVNTIRRNVLSGAVEPSQLSDLISPAYQSQIAGVDQADMLTDIFAVYDRLAGYYMLFVPMDGSDEKRVFVYTFGDKAGRKAWSEFNGWAWRAATSTALGRVFFAKDTRIYQYGNEAYSEEFSADLIGEFDATWNNSVNYDEGDRILDADNDTVYVCQVEHTSAVSGTFEEDRDDNPTFWIEYEGEDIEFDWEFPWTDANSRARIKRLGFVKMDTQGTSQFTVSIFVDNIYLNQNQDYDPALTLTYVAGDSPGYGGGDQPYGGGRRTTDERLWSHPVKFMIAKLRIHGSTKKPLRVVTITLMFSEGRYGR